MHDAGGVRGLERETDLRDDRGGPIGGEFLLLVEDRPEVLPLDVLHRDELHPLGRPEVEDPDDVGVRDLARRDQLVLEPFEDLPVPGEVAADDLDRHESVDLAVSRLVDGPHPPLAEQCQDLVAVSEDASRLQCRQRTG